jgi:exonuclease 3'-5' domain-containing protein 2
LKLQHRKSNNLFDGIPVYSLSGQLMHRTSRRKANYYVCRGLAVIKNQTPLSITLSFVPRGEKYIVDSLQQQIIENQCVVCGARDNLTKHHLVPNRYRKHLCKIYLALKYDLRDTLLVCENCHIACEKHNEAISRRLSLWFKSPLNGIGFKPSETFRTLCRIKKTAIALLKHKDKIPIDAKINLKAELENLIGKDPSYQNIIDCSAMQLDPRSDVFVGHGKLVVDKIKDHAKFIRMWRRHFIRSMKPKFMPVCWDIDNCSYLEQ